MKRIFHKKEKQKESSISMIIQALLIAMVLRSVLVQPFTIPSASMYPTMMIGDYFYVTKYSYGISRYSFPFGGYWLPDFGRIAYDEPQQGDVVVFREVNSGNDYIKRIVAKGGDTVQLKNGLLYINDKPVKKTRLDDTVVGTGNIPTYRETLPSGRSYTVWETAGDNSMADNTDQFVVPENHFFMLGDNRDQSADSRFSNVGAVSYDALVGKAQYLLFSLEDTRIWEFWKWFTHYREGRSFKGVQ